MFFFRPLLVATGSSSTIICSFMEEGRRVDGGIFMQRTRIYRTRSTLYVFIRAIGMNNGVEFIHGMGSSILLS